MRALSVEQAQTFIKAALPTPIGPVLAVALTTGMRPSEYLGLKFCRRKRAPTVCVPEGRDLVFKTASGHPIHADYLAKHFKMILELAGLPRIRRFAPLGGHNRAGSRSVGQKLSLRDRKSVV